MRAFLVQFALTYVASALLLSSAGHLTRPHAFAELVRRHGIVPGTLVLPVTLLVLALELVMGIGAVAQIAGGGSSASVAVLLGSAVVLGGLFALYVRRLLRTAAAAETTCGCSPFPGRLTSASYLPALGLMGAALCGWASAVSGALPPDLGSLSLTSLLPALWAMTLATAVALVPATVPGSLGVEA